MIWIKWTRLLGLKRNMWSWRRICACIHHKGLIDVIHKLERYPPVQIVLYIDGIDTVLQEHEINVSCQT